VGVRSALAEKRLKREDEPDELFLLLDFFDTIGLLVTNKYLDAADV
jgi:hypothetical protein